MQNRCNAFKTLSLKVINRISIILLVLILIAAVIVWDLIDRGRYSSKQISSTELNIFYKHKTSEAQEEAFRKNFGNIKYKFPREETKKIKLFKNDLLVSRITSKTLSELNQQKIIAFFNNPDNFDWGETTWSEKESEFILRFYNSDNEEIGKVWLCLNGCGMTESVPFSPNMKYGGLSKMGTIAIEELLESILDD